MGSITETSEWQDLVAHFEHLRDAELRDLFDADPQRGTRLAVDAEGLYFDYSKHRVTEATIAL
ncbi:MAG: glucose-6-phosphate isomerase, partial [Acidimicrobiia bacterium]